MERRQLEYFLAVVRCGGITKAAARLHVSQPTISASLRRLEKELGGALFERASSGLILTEAGHALQAPARQVLRDFGVAEESARGALGLQGGRIEICAVPAVSAGWLTPVIAAFRRTHPQIDISLRAEYDNQRIAEDVRTGKAGIGFAVSPVSPDGLLTREVGSQELQALFPPGSSNEGEPIDIDELARMDLITVRRELTTSRPWFEAELRRRGIQPRIPVEMGSIDSVLPLVTEGVGYALWWTPMSPSMVGSCVLRPLRPGFRRPITLLRRAGPLSPATAAFVEAAGVPAAE